MQAVDSSGFDGEVWKPCIGFEGLYEVSNKERVKGLKRNNILSPAISPNGRQRVVLCKDNKTKQYYVDHLVTTTFSK